MIRSEKNCPDATAGPLPKAARIREYVRCRVGILVALGILGSIPIPLARFYWLFELTTHFRVHYFLAFTLLLAIALGARAWRWAGIAAVILIIHASALAPWYIPQPLPEGTSEPIRIMTANVFTSNTDYNALISLIKENDPDIFLLQEINEEWLTALQPLKAQYPYVLAKPRNDNFGIATFSRIKFTERTSLNDRISGIPALKTVINIHGRRLVILNYHTLPPADSAHAKTRNRQLARLQEICSASEHLLIVAGDLNTAMWSPNYRDLVREGKLKNARKGFGIQPTWLRARLPFFGLPLDHVLTSANIHATNFRVLPDFGSDHRPILVELRLQL